MSEEENRTLASNYQDLLELHRFADDGSFIWTDGEMTKMFENAQVAGRFSPEFGPALRLFITDDLRACRGNFFSSRHPYGGKVRYPVSTTPRGKAKRLGRSKNTWHRVRRFLEAVGAIEFEEEPKPGGRTVYRYHYKLGRLESLLLGRPFKVGNVTVDNVAEPNSPRDVKKWLAGKGLLDETFQISGPSGYSPAAPAGTLNELAAPKNELEAPTGTDHTRSHSPSHKKRSHLVPFSKKENSTPDNIREKDFTEKELAVLRSEYFEQGGADFEGDMGIAIDKTNQNAIPPRKDYVRNVLLGQLIPF